MKLVYTGVALTVLAAYTNAGQTCATAGEVMRPTEFQDIGSAKCKAVRGGVRTCQVVPTCADGEKWLSLANGDGTCAARACVTWPPACPSGERYQPIEFINNGGLACAANKAVKGCAPNLRAPNSAKEGTKCADGERPKSMVQADGSCGPMECTAWPPACGADEEFRPITFEPRVKNNGEFAQFCKTARTPKVKGCRSVLACGPGQVTRSLYNADDGTCGARSCYDKHVLSCPDGEKASWPHTVHTDGDEFCRPDRSGARVCQVACGSDQTRRSVANADGTCATPVCVDKGQSAADEAGCGADERLGPVDCVAFNSSYCKCDKDGAQGCVPKCGDTMRLKSLWDGATCGSPICELKN